MKAFALSLISVVYMLVAALLYTQGATTAMAVSMVPYLFTALTMYTYTERNSNDA